MQTRRKLSNEKKKTLSFQRKQLLPLSAKSTPFFPHFKLRKNKKESRNFSSGFPPFSQRPNTNTPKQKREFQEKEYSYSPDDNAKPEIKVSSNPRNLNAQKK
jgi:hypothetical protein